MQQGTKHEFAHRLNLALDEHGVPGKFNGRQVAVAKLFGVSQKGAAKWLEGDGMPTLEKSIEICKALNIHVEWLLAGRGPMRPAAEQADSLIEALPTEVRQETFDFLEFKIQKTFSGDQLGRYLLWLDHMRKNPPPKPR